MNKAVTFSERVYGRLLRLYPKRFRADYGEEMRRLFADQYAAACQAGRLAVVALWVRTLADGASSILREHLEESKGNMSIQSVLHYFDRKFTFSRIFVVATLCLLALCVSVTLLLPKVYQSTARVVYRPTQGTYDPYQVQVAFEKIHSKRILNQVIDELQLGKAFANEAGITGELDPEQTYQMLLSRIQLRQSRNTSLVDISVFSNKPEFGATIANKIAEVAGREQGATVVDTASPSQLRPVRPNVPLNIVLGAVLSVVAGVILAGIGRFVFWAVSPRA